MFDPKLADILGFDLSRPEDVVAYEPIDRQREEELEEAAYQREVYIDGTVVLDDRITLEPAS